MGLGRKKRGVRGLNVNRPSGQCLNRSFVPRTHTQPNGKPQLHPERLTPESSQDREAQKAVHVTVEGVLLHTGILAGRPAVDFVRLLRLLPNPTHIFPLA